MESCGDGVDCLVGAGGRWVGGGVGMDTIRTVEVPATGEREEVVEFSGVDCEFWGE